MIHSLSANVSVMYFSAGKQVTAGNKLLDEKQSQCGERDPGHQARPAPGTLYRGFWRVNHTGASVYVSTLIRKDALRLD